MRILRYDDPDYAGKIRALISASSNFDAEIESRVHDIIRQVKENGDHALVDYTRRFDGAQLTPPGLALSQAELVSASVQATRQLRLAVKDAHANILKFSRKSLRHDWSTRNRHQARVGEKYDAFARVGIYIPGGTAPLVSTALMTVSLAKVAGCREIAVCTPCNARGEVNPSLLYALLTAGATEIYRVGGAQAIAAMALGTTQIRRVQKIFGPGNAYVVAAKRLLFGSVAIDLLPGPSEVLILADVTAPASYVAADMLAQAEHGSGHERVWLVTHSARLLKSVARLIEVEAAKLARKSYIDKVLKLNTVLVQVKSLEQGIALATDFAPEHCELMVRNPKRWIPKLTTAGAIFLGSYSPTVLGDYVAGPSHELPTGGAGHCFAGLTVDQFQRRTSVVEYNRNSLAKALASVLTFAEIEGLTAHGRSAAVRLKKS
jgi:histidinol dehydrogenase